jgi:hypothetical protein
VEKSNRLRQKLNELKLRICNEIFSELNTTHQLGIDEKIIAFLNDKKELALTEPLNLFSIYDEFSQSLPSLLKADESNTDELKSEPETSQVAPENQNEKAEKIREHLKEVI